MQTKRQEIFIDILGISVVFGNMETMGTELYIQSQLEQEIFVRYFPTKPVAKPAFLLLGFGTYDQTTRGWYLCSRGKAKMRARH